MRVEWVHPSWRDLVIGRLKHDARARREFITRSGVHGAVLALSTAGGSAGERRLPLIGSDGDWDALTDRLYSLIVELESAELEMVLTALCETINDLGRRAEVGEAWALARAVLSRTANVWDTRRRPIPLPALDAWVALARLIRPRAPLPDLSITWVELLPARAPGLDDRPALERFTEWLWLCELLSGYGPELYVEFGFGTEQVELMAQFQADVYRYQLTRSLQSTALDLVLRAVGSIAQLEDRLSPDSREITYALLGQATDASLLGGPPAPPPALSEAFDVRRVLGDL